MMLLFVTLSIFTVLAILVVWRLSRTPVRGDVQIRLLWRGAAAGLAGWLIAGSLSLMLFRPSAFWYVGYVYLLLISVVLGLAFTFAAWGVQRAGPTLNLLTRAAAGGVLGALTAWGWSSWMAAPHVAQGGDGALFSRSVIAVIVTTGIVSGALASPSEGEHDAP